MNTKKYLLLFFATVSVFVSKAQIDPYEFGQPSLPTAVPNNDYNKIEYDRCTGTLNIAIESTKSGTSGTWPIKVAFIYVKIGSQWRKMTTIRSLQWTNLGSDGYPSHLATGTAPSDPWSSGESAITSAAWSPAFFTPVVGGVYGDMVDVPNDLRIAYANGAYNNHSWASYEDHNICESYDANLNPTGGQPMDLVPWVNPPRLHVSHSSQIAQNMQKIAFYPTTGGSPEWGIQLGITNIPLAAMAGDVINVRIYKHTRSMCCQNSTAAGNNAYEVIELATSVNAVDAPFGLSATDDQCGQVTLNWQNPTQSWSANLNCTNAQTYRNIIYRNGVRIGITNGDVTTFVDNTPGLQQRVEYDYTVAKILWNRNNKTYRSSGVSNVAKGSMKLPPAQPSPFNATNDRCDGSVNLTWTQPTGTAVDEYIIQRWNGNTLEQTYTGIAGTKKSYLDVTATRGVEYDYKIIAENNCNYPSDTGVAIGLSPADPAMASGLAVTVNATADTATLIWRDNANNETKYQVHRQDNEGNVVIFDVNKNDGSGDTLTFYDDGIVSCVSYSYSVVVFNECVQSGIKTLPVGTGIIPPPNLSNSFTASKKLRTSKGYFSNRVELAWSYNNSNNIDIFKIYRKELGSTNDSTLIATANQGSGFLVDNTTDAGVFYKYSIAGFKFCDTTEIQTNVSEDIGFRYPTAFVNGHIDYTGGVAVEGVRVTAESSTGSALRSINLSNAQQVIVKHKANLQPASAFTAESWIKPTSVATAFDIIDKSGSYKLSWNGTNLVGSVTTGGAGTATGGTLTAGTWTHVGMTYDGSEIKLFINGAEVGATAQTGAVATSTDSIVIGRTFVGGVDETRIYNVALDSVTMKRRFERYLLGNETGMVCYLVYDEGDLNRTFDQSFFGAVYNQNDAYFEGGATWSTNIPSANQLGFIGYTDALGDYTLLVRYFGTGQNFKVTPVFGTHAFEPTNKILFLGDANKSANGTDFEDISSFPVSGTLFYKNTSCPVDGATLKVDGKVVVVNGNPALTDVNGDFNIQVPIGNHFVTIEKNGHVMSAGRFPPTGNYDFQQQVTGITFIDSTLVTIVGRVAGGLREAQKFPGLGRGKNNIGVAEIVLTSTQGGGCYKDTIYTNDSTGEYTVSLPPLRFNPTVKIVNNPTINFGVLDQIDVSGTPSLTTKYDTIGYDTINAIYSIDSITYNKKLDYIYRVNPKIYVRDYDDPTKLFNGVKNYVYTHPNGSKDSIDLTLPGSPIPWALFDARSEEDSISCLIQVYEEYENLDNGTYDTVPTTDGTLEFNNELSLLGIHSVQMKDINTLDSLKYLKYTFEIGTPSFIENVSIPEFSFTKKWEIRLKRSNGTTIPWLPNNYKGTPFASNDGIFRGYIMGTTSNGNQFTTQGPQIPEYILRDPPGSNSTASREVSSTKSTENSWSWNLAGSVASTDKVFIGTKFASGIGVAIETDVKNNVNTGFTATTSGGRSGTESVTVTNTQSWETNGDFLPGRSSDLYIGKSKNVEFGISQTLHLVPDSMCSKVECLGSGFPGYSFAKQYGLSIVPGGYGTQFILSEEDIKALIIPDLIQLRNIMLQTNSKYTSHLPIDDENYGLNNDDPRVDPTIPHLSSNQKIAYMLRLGDSTFTDEVKDKNGTTVQSRQIGIPTQAQKAVWDRLDSLKSPSFQKVLTGASYTYNADSKQDSLTGDSVRFINNQIKQWEDAIMLNEWEKVNVGNTAIREKMKKAELAKLFDRNRDVISRYKLLMAASTTATILGTLATAAPIPGIGLKGFASFAVGTGTGIAAAETFAEYTRYELAEQRILDKYTETPANYTISGGNAFTSSMTHESASSFTRSIEYGMEASLGLEIEGTVGNNGVGLERSISVNFSSGRDWTQSTSSSETVSFTLLDGDQQDLFSVDVFPSLLGWGPIFKLKPGGRTACPHEDRVLTQYYMDDSANMASNPDFPYVELSARTLQIEKVDITAAPTLRTNIPVGNAATFNMTLANLSETGDDVLYRVRVDPASNPFGAIVKMDGVNPNTDIFIPGSSALNKVVTIEKGPGGTYKYDSIRILLHSICQYSPGDETDDYPNIVDTAWISAHFIPTCTDVSFSTPENLWVLNNDFNDTMPIAVVDYDINFYDFNSIRLDYKPSASSTWVELETFFKDTAGMNDTNKIEIPRNVAFTLWDWETDQLVDGEYDLRLVTQCTLADKVSITHSGIMDRINPHPFGTPSPADGILEPNDDIKIQFNEPIDIGSLTSLNFDVRAVLNGTELRHDASIYFDGVDDELSIANGLTLNNSFTIEKWVKRARLNTEEVYFGQGINANQSLELGFNAANFPFIKLAGQTFTATTAVADNDWHHITVVFDKENDVVEFFIDGALAGNNGAFFANYTEGGEILIAQSGYRSAPFNGNMHELRIWKAPQTLADVSGRMTKTLSGQEFDLISVWPMDEAIGGQAEDDARSRHAILKNGATWSILPSGRGMNFDGVDDDIVVNTSEVAFTDEMDFTIEFWFNGAAQGDSASLFSNGTGTDSLGLTWDIFTTASNKIFVRNNGITTTVTNNNYFNGQWHHFAMVMRRSANVDFFIDGNQVSSVPAQNFGEFGAANATYGTRRYFVGTTEFIDHRFTGIMDEFRIWNLARRQEQIKRDRVSRLAGNEKGLALYLPFEEYTEVLNVPVLTPSLKEIISDSVALNNGTATYEAVNIPAIKLPRPVQQIPVTFSVNSDAMVITPNIDPAQIENVTLDITVQGVKDLAGNVMQSPETWIAYIDKNQVVWQDVEKNLEINVDETPTFTNKVLNTGGQLKDWEITNLPDWLTVSTTTGAANPNSSETITFEVKAGVNIGTYVQDIYLTTDFGYNEKYTITLKVTEEPPAYDVDPSDFQYSMSVIGQISVDSIISTDEEDLLVAKVNGEVRGVTNLKYYSQYDKYMAFLDVYSDSLGGELVEFEIWDASEGKVHIEVTPSLTFNNNSLEGAPNNPIIFNALNIIYEPIALKKGWNWVSFNLNSPVSDDVNKLLDGVAASNGDVIKSKTKYDQFSTSIGWVGSITAAGGTRNDETYKIKVSQDDIIEYYGAKLDPTAEKIYMDSGWNWIGVIALRTVSVDDAFGNYNPSHGDLLKSQTAFAVYDSLLGWVGNLEFMKPNKGYMYKSDKVDSLVYPVSAYFNIQEREKEAALPSLIGQVNEHDYMYDTRIIATSNYCQGREGEYELYAYVGDEMRGGALVKDGLFFLTVYSNKVQGEELTFKVKDYNGDLIAVDHTLSFNADKQSGEINTPIYLPIKGDCENRFEGDVSENGLSVFPNPFNEELSITILVEETQEVTVELLDVSGRRLKQLFNREMDRGNHLINLSLDKGMALRTGQYFLSINRGGVTEMVKIIKMNQ